ncbi:MAG TPA: hypothetical protein VJR90_08445 [Gammaproteobacteria bacterium]|nr:hypothetical protein [Gammaproteobacteria bacterium]
MQDPESKTAYRHWSGLTTGLVVIAVGVAFLLWNFDVRLPFMRYRNWWALFILIGAVGPLSYALHRYREKRRFDGGVLHSLISAAAIIVVALMFLLNLDWTLWWPVFIIIGGLYMLANHWNRDTNSSST